MVTELRETAAERHDRMVREEREQTEAVASRMPPSDFWQGQAGRFRPHKGERGDSADLDALLSLIGTGDRVIDVGAGGGRLALPLAARCREVVAVEPSPAMRGVLEDEVERRGVRNLRVVAAAWEDAEVPRAELAFTSHVTYGVQAIEPFLRKLDRTATRHAVVIAYINPPQFIFAPFWRAVYGEARLRLPCAAELIAVLQELGAEPDVTALPPLPAQTLGPRDEAIEELRRRLFAAPGSEADRRLHEALPDLVEERDGVLAVRGAPQRERRVIHWRPGSLR